MSEIRFNNAPSALFTCSEQGDTRETLVAQGRLFMYEANGRETSRYRKNSGFESRLPKDKNYRDLAESYKQKLLMHCAKVAKVSNGEEAPKSYEDFIRYQSDFYNDKSFFRALSGVVRDIIRPVLPYVISNAVGELGQTVEVGFGETYEISVASNDVMIFSDGAWGALRSAPMDTLYDYPITLNPQMKVGHANVKWRQLIANGSDIGLWLNSLVAGMYSKIMAMWSSALVSASSNSFFVPSYLQKSSYTTANLISLAKSVAEVNHVDTRNLVCYGDWLALSKVLPTGTAQDAALTYGLGSEFNSNGYLGTVMGIPMHKFDNVIVPGTQNTTGTEVLPTDKLWIAASRANGTAPLYIGMEAGTPIQLELNPMQTADGSIDVILGFSIDVKAVFGSKVGVISNV